MQHQDGMADSSIIPLNRDYFLRVQSVEQGVTGEIILRNQTHPNEGTCLFTAPLRDNVDELLAWSGLALKAYMEG